MYEYKYLEVILGLFSAKADHYEIIDREAKEGWRLAQVIPMKYDSYGKLTEYEIIFERKID